MAEKKKIPAADKSDKRAKIIIVRHFGDQDFVQLYAEYVANKILERVKAEQKSA